MIDDLLERAFPGPSDADPDITKGEAYWIRFYCWYSRFLPVRVYTMQRDHSFRFEIHWRRHAIYRSSKTEQWA